MSEEIALKITRGRPRKYVYPSKLTCTITGRVVKTNPTQMKAMLEKSGKDLATLIATYVCRSARKQQNADITADSTPANSADSEGV